MISLIATVLNEGESIHRLMRSLAGQTRLPDELVIVDGGSSDDTVAVIESYGDRLPIRVLVEPGCNISQGRNRAIAAARGDIIVVTDAGVIVEASWLERISQPLLENPNCQFVGGFFRPDYTTPFELAMSVTVLPEVSDIRPRTFLPSSRSAAFRKAIWQAVEGYPEWLDYCEDLVFDLQVKAWIRDLPDGAFRFVPEAVVAFRPRGSLRGFFKQYYLYARGDGKADLWRKRHAARYLTYGVALPVILLLGLGVHPALHLLALPGAAVYLRRPYQRLLHVRGASAASLLLAALYIPVIRVVGDLAKMMGYPVGWVWRLRANPPDWKQV